MEDFQKRSIAKTISWRVTATLTTIFIVYLFTGKMTLSIGVGFVEAFSKMVLYFIHERAWQRVKWGMHPLASIELKKRNLDKKDILLVKEKLRELGYL